MGQDEISCKGMDLNMTDAQRGHITECLRENGIKSIWKIPVEKLPVSAFPSEINFKLLSILQIEQFLNLFLVLWSLYFKEEETGEN